MSEQPDAVTPLYGAPMVEEDHAITVTAPWHHAGPTGAVDSPPVQEIRNYETSEDGKTVTATKVLKPPVKPTRNYETSEDAATVAAKVIEPPAKATRKTGRQAEAKRPAEQDPEA